MKNFNWNRFAKVVVYDARSIWPTFGTTMLTFAILPVAFWIINLIFSPDMTLMPEGRLATIGFFATVTVILAPSRIYKNCNIQKRGIHFAMLPASKCEKFCSMLLFTLIVCPLLYGVAALLADTVLWLLPFGSYRDSLHLFATLCDTFRVSITRMGGDTLMVVLLMLFSYLNTTALFFFTNTVFKKHKVLMTFVWGMIVAFAMTVIVVPIVMNSDFTWVQTWLEKADPERAMHNLLLISVVMNAITSVGLYIWSYYRLKKMRY